MTIKVDETYFKVKDRVLNFISYHPRTEYEVLQKLEEVLKYTSDVSDENREQYKDQILDELRKTSLVDDPAYARAYVRKQFRSPRPKSPMESKQFLYQKGIPRDLIDLALGEYSRELEMESIKKIIAKRPLEKKKLITYLRRKGYSFESINHVVNSN